MASISCASGRSFSCARPPHQAQADGTDVPSLRQLRPYDIASRKRTELQFRHHVHSDPSVTTSIRPYVQGRDQKLGTRERAEGLTRDDSLLILAL